MYQGSEPSAPLTVMLDTAVKFRGADIFMENNMSGMREDEVDGFDENLSKIDDKRRADQSDTNFKYIFGILEKIHANLCPGQNGTWQMRCEQVLKASARYEAVRKLTPLKFGELYRINMKTGRAFDDLVDDLVEGRLIL